MSDISLIDTVKKHFPYENPRDGQLEVIYKIINAFETKKFFIAELPTGAGKSGIGITLAKYYNSAYYLTSSKLLQTQITDEFTDVVDLKGRNAYDCTFWKNVLDVMSEKPDEYDKLVDEIEKVPLLAKTAHKKNLNCANSPCKVIKRPHHNLCVPNPDAHHTDSSLKCPYWKRLRQAQESDIVVFNLKSFIFNVHRDGFGKKELLILDEVQLAEKNLLDIVQLTLKENDFFGCSVKLNNFKDIDEAKKYFTHIDLENIIEQLLSKATITGNNVDINKYEDIKHKFAIFNTHAGSKEWVMEQKVISDEFALTFKPIYINKFFEQYIAQWANKILLMSATILSPDTLRYSLGIDKENSVSYRSNSRFPKENRPIYVTNVGSMSYKKKLETMPKLLTKVEEIMEHYSDEKGIIHTHNFEIANYVYNNISEKHKSRLVYQKNFNRREDVIDEHKRGKNSVIIAPAMNEGLNLNDDLARFAILCKIPYPSFKDDEQLKIRMEESRDYYTWLTACSFVQAYGRSIRSETDWAHTYIIDSDFNRFYQDAEKMLPKWFKEAIDWG